MSHDTRDRRPPLRASELPPSQVMLYPGVRAVVCPGCGCWQVPKHGHFRRHDLPPEELGRSVSLDRDEHCPETGRAVWFDVSPAQLQASLRVAERDAARRHGTRVHGTRPIPQPLRRSR